MLKTTAKPNTTVKVAAPTAPALASAVELAVAVAANTKVPKPKYGLTLHEHHVNPKAVISGLRTATMPEHQAVRLGPNPIGAGRIGGTLRSTLEAAFNGHGTLEYCKIAGLTLGDGSIVAQHLTYLTGHGMLSLA